MVKPCTRPSAPAVSVALVWALFAAGCASKGAVPAVAPGTDPPNRAAGAAPADAAGFESGGPREPSRVAEDSDGLPSDGSGSASPAIQGGAEASAEPAAAVEPESETAEAPAKAPVPAVTYAPLADFHRGGIRLEVTRRVATGLLPKSVEVSPDGKTLWVCNFGRRDEDNVWVYDRESLDRIAVVEFPGNAVETIWSADAKTVFISNFKRGVVERIDAETYELLGEIEVGFNPKIMVATPDGKYLYVANWSSNDVSVVDLERGETVDRLRVGEHPRGMALRSDGRLFVNAMYDHRVHVFDAPSAGGGDAVEFKSCFYPRHSVLSPGEDRLYITCSGSDKVFWYDPETFKRRGWAKVGDNPRSMGMTDDGRFLAVADYRGATVSLVDVQAGTFDSFHVEEAEKIVGVAVAPGPELVVYATSWVTAELIELRPASP